MNVTDLPDYVIYYGSAKAKDDLKRVKQNIEEIENLIPKIEPEKIKHSIIVCEDDLANYRKLYFDSGKKTVSLSILFQKYLSFASISKDTNLIKIAKVFNEDFYILAEFNRAIFNDSIHGDSYISLLSKLIKPYHCVIFCFLEIMNDLIVHRKKHNSDALIIDTDLTKLMEQLG